MLGPLLAAFVAVQVPQDAPLDVPVFEDTAYGVALARPWRDWVFEPARSRGTTTVIFSPRLGSLRDQLWGALVLTTLGRDVDLGRIADQRVASSWQPTLGPSFQLLTRDSLALLGLPAIHVVMTGSISLAVLDVEEYLIARGTDLILLQFRYPRGLPRDSIAQGYERALRGLRIRGGAVAGAEPSGAPVPIAPAVQPAAALPAPIEGRGEPWTAPPFAAIWQALGHSPWIASRVDAQIRFGGARVPLVVEARLDLVNDGTVPADSLPIWLPPGTMPDSVRLGLAVPLVGLRAGGTRLPLTDPVAPQGRLTVVVWYRRPALGDGATVVDPWLPDVQAAQDSLGQPRGVPVPRATLRFDLPPDYAAVAPGRLTSDLAAERRRMTWIADDTEEPARPAFAIGRLERTTRRAGRLDLYVWAGPATGDTPPDSTVALIALGWSFCARAFGPASAPRIDVVVGTTRSRGLPGVLLLSRADLLDADVILREVARTWWGGAVRGAGEGGMWIDEALPAWVAVAARGVLEGDSVRRRLAASHEMLWRARQADPPLARFAPQDGADLAWLRAKGVIALETTREAAGDARFREALRTLAVERRGRGAGAADLLLLLDDSGASVLRVFLFGR